MGSRECLAAMRLLPDQKRVHKFGGMELKKTVKRIILLAAVFLLVVIAAVAVAIYRNRDTASLEAMEGAAFPIIRLVYGDGLYHELHGYADKMDPVSVRDSITPLQSDRSLTVTVDTYGREVRSVSYQIRSLDGSHLVEDTQVASFQQQDRWLTAKIQISNLIQENTEYVMMLEVDTDIGAVYYYSRVIYGEAMRTNELLTFVRQFSDATLDEALESNFGISSHLQTDSSIGASDYSYTNIHSTRDMVTWGDWDPERSGEVKTKITELSDTQMSVVLSYTVHSSGQETPLYDVEEFFCVRYRNDRVYLLDYRRTVNQRLSIKEEDIQNGSLSLGITEKDCQVLQVKNQESNAVSQVVFSHNGQVWSYLPEENALRQIFSFSDPADDGVRDGYDAHEVNIVRGYENGDVDFLVYGYMNRGGHEGRVGISFYRYSKEDNALEEKFFVPVTVASQVLCADLGELSYVNRNDICYFLYGSCIYSVDLVSGECVLVTNRAAADTYAKNTAGNLVAWQEGEDLRYPERIRVLNMDTGEISSIEAADGEYVKLENFIETDLVYGIGRKEDVVVESGEVTQYPLYALVIVDAMGQMSQEERYERDGIYIMDVSVTDRQVAMKRALKEADGTYRETDDDMLLLNYADEVQEDTLVTAKTSDVRKREYYVNLGIKEGMQAAIAWDLPLLEHRQEQYQVVLEEEEDPGAVYYVYAGGGLLSTRGNLSEAVAEAYDNMGVVVDSSQSYLWTRGTRDVYKTLSMELLAAGANDESLAAALQMMIQYEGGQEMDTQTALAEGQSVYQILSMALPDETVLDLQGCQIPHLLYYINENHPVLALTGDGSAKLILGYDSVNVTIYDPFGGQTYTMSQEEATQSFVEFGNRFYSCVSW